MSNLFMLRNAILSDCGQYRYLLERDWSNGDSQRTVAFVMLNPSTADGTEDDPTIRRCIGYAKAWGYNRLLVGNVFAYRATDPKELLSMPGIDRDTFETAKRYLHSMINDAELVVCAWGNSPILKRLGKDNAVDDCLSLWGYTGKMHYLELSKDGTPKHPLYLRKDLKPKQFSLT